MSGRQCTNKVLSYCIGVLNNIFLTMFVFLHTGFVACVGYNEFL